MVLSRKQAQSFYDRFGKKQDAQAFYEDAALAEMVAQAAFGQAENVFEFGCGTGRFALSLLTKYLPASATYLGSDLSLTMVEIARQRLAPFAERAKLVHSDGSANFSLSDGSVDRVISTYVFDLLSATDISGAIAEAHRVLTPDGKLCLVSLAEGVTTLSRIVSKLWSIVFYLRASLVGGCRPIRLSSFFDQDDWIIEHHNVVTQFGVPSEVLIASPKTNTRKLLNRNGA